jgi:LysM repeat protein
VDAGASGEDPDAALRRLESMGTGGTPTQPPADREPLPPAPVVDPFGEPPARRSQRPMGSSKKTPRVRPRPAGSRGSRIFARIAAPVAFLVAVIALVGILVNSAAFDSGSATTPTPTPTKSAAVKIATKNYVVKSGDSLSSIASRFRISTAELLRLNPDLDGTSTLVVGTRIIVPKQ